MTLDQFHRKWKSLYVDNGQQATALVGLFRECCGGHKGGLLFYDYSGDITVLKCDENKHCYKRINDSDDEDSNWEWIGELINDPGENLPPLT